MKFTGAILTLAQGSGYKDVSETNVSGTSFLLPYDSCSYRGLVWREYMEQNKTCRDVETDRGSDEAKKGKR